MASPASNAIRPPDLLRSSGERASFRRLQFSKIGYDTVGGGRVFRRFSGGRGNQRGIFYYDLSKCV